MEEARHRREREVVEKEEVLHMREREEEVGHMEKEEVRHVREEEEVGR